MRSERIFNAVLLVLATLFVVVGGLYAVLTPPWQAPDEPAHYNYVAQVAGAGCCPVIAPGDWDSAQLGALLGEQFPPHADLSPIEYEDHQPPLYYLLAAPVFVATGGSLLALRLFSVALGAGLLIVSALAARQIFPARLPLALSAGVFVAFVPQHVAILASVNNDALAELVLAAVILAALAYSTGARRLHPAVLGLLVGLAFLTKLTVYGPAVLAAAAAITVRAGQEQRPFGWFVAQAAWAGGVALVLGALWWARNAAVYGWPDVLAQAAHNRVVVGQLRTAELLAEIGQRAYLNRFVTTTFHSFWGQFGWMAVPMPARIYWLAGLFSAFAAAGLVVLFVVRRPALTPTRRATLWVLAVVLLATAANYLIYNRTFVQLQGRYLFTALLPLGVLASAGLWGWARLLGGASEPRSRLLVWLPLIVMLWLPALAVYALFRFVVPFLG